MQRIGVIGPKDSVNRIVEVAKSMNEEIELVPFIYSDVSETIEIVKKNFTKIKDWLFSGPTPYNTARKWFRHILIYGMKVKSMLLLPV